MQNQYMVVENVNRVVFTGKTLCVGGVGHFDNVTPPDLLSLMDFVLAQPGDTKILCGNELTKRNFSFCLKAEP